MEQASPAAADLLRACVFLAPDAIPEDLLLREAAEGGIELQAIAKNPFLWNETIGELLKYSLVRRNREHKTLSIHRLVQAVLRDSMDEPTIQQWVERTIHAVGQAFPSNIDPTTWISCARLLPHMQACLVLVEQHNLASPEVAHLFSQAAFYLKEHGRYTEAEPLYRRVLALREKMLGPKHPDTATSFHNLGLLYHSQGRYELAEPLYQRALAIQEKVLGPEHPDTATTLENYAELLRKTQRRKEAEALEERSAAIRAKQQF